MTTAINNTISNSNKEQRMELFNDFSFKYIFRREFHKDLLIALLNDLLQGDKIITEIEYMNSEKSMPAWWKWLESQSLRKMNG